MLMGIKRISTNKIVIISTIILFFLILNNIFIVFLPSSAKTFIFCPKVLITDDNLNNTGLSATPRMVIDIFDNIHVVWVDESNINNSGTDPDIFYKKFDFKTKMWGPRILITDDNINNTEESSQPSITADPFGNIHIVWWDWSNLNASGADADIFYKQWIIDTSSWGPRILITDDNINNTGDSDGPYITSDSLGNIHIVWVDESDLNNSGTDRDIFYKKWNFITKKWEPRKLITDDNINNTQDSRSPKITTDPLNNLHIVWNDFSNLTGSGSDGDIFYRKWDFATKKWCERVLITDDNVNNTEMSWYPIITSDINNNIHIAWIEGSDLDGSGSDEDVYYRKWDNLTSSWGPRILITDDNTNNTDTSWNWGIAADNYGNPYIVWYDNSDLDNSGTDFDIYLKYWDNETSSWGPRILITNDNANNTEDSCHPFIAFSSTNTMHIIWHDKSNLSNNGLDRDIFYMRTNFLPPMATPISPFEGLTIINNTPKLVVTSVIDLDKDAVYYNFTISDQSDAESGTVYYSDWITSTSWKPPPLSDGKWYWHIYTYDGFNITSPNWVWNFTIDTSQGYGIQLQEGWNLISILFIQMDTDLSSVLNSINGSYDAVQLYNAGDNSDHWKHNHISKPSQMNDLWDIDHKMGIWVHVTEPGGVLLQCSGIIPTENQSINLKTGWNLVGYPSLSNKTRNIALNNLFYDADVDAIWTYNGSSQLWMQISEFDYFERGRGYWIHAKTECVWEVPL